MNFVEEENEKFSIHKAKIISNNLGNIYDKDVLKQLEIGNVVRISFIVLDNHFDDWTHDSPYLKIIKKNKNLYLGEVQNINRIKNTNKYPLPIGEKIWFNEENIIEIPNNQNSIKSFDSFLTNEYISITGPLYTIKSDDETSETSDVYSESDSESYS